MGIYSATNSYKGIIKSINYLQKSESKILLNNNNNTTLKYYFITSQTQP